MTSRPALHDSNASPETPRPASDLLAPGNPIPAPESDSSPLAALAQWQIDVATARAALLDECQRVAHESNTGVAQAEIAFVHRAKSRNLPQATLDLLRMANARRGENRTISARRLTAWREAARGAASPIERVARLAPGLRGKRWKLAQDEAAALALYRRPNKPALRWCVAQVAGGISGPGFASLYARCRRLVSKLPKAVFYGGRNSGAALKALLPFRRREFLSLEPNDVWIGDGHSAKVRIAHPGTGKPFVPEVTVILDVATRYVVGWSVAMSENCIAVSDALRHAVSRHGRPLVYYSDGGSGQKNKMFDAPVTGILGGLGIHHETGRPNHPQARGVIERVWPTVLIPFARRFATFQGRGADRDTLRRVTREIDRDLRAAQRGEIATLPRRLATFQEFVEAMEIEIEAYNTTHRHRSLPKLDGVNHATPAEYRAALLNGAAPEIPSPQELASFFMPSVVRVASRGEVKVWNSSYSHDDLMLVDGDEVLVRQDIHDASYVLVHKLSGEFIARAELNGNRSDYMPKSLIERLRDEREARRRKLLEAKLADVAAERSAATLSPQLTPEEYRALEAEFDSPAPVNVLQLSDPAKQEHWRSLEARRAAGEQLAGQDADFHAAWQGSDYFRIAQEANGEFERQMAQRDVFLRTSGPRCEPTVAAEEVGQAAMARLRKSAPKVTRRVQRPSSIAARTTERRARRKSAR